MNGALHSLGKCKKCLSRMLRLWPLLYRAGIETLRVGNLGIQISNALIVGATANVELETATYEAPLPDTDGVKGTLTTVGW